MISPSMFFIGFYLFIIDLYNKANILDCLCTVCHILGYGVTLFIRFFSLLCPAYLSLLHLCLRLFPVFVPFLCLSLSCHITVSLFLSLPLLHVCPISVSVSTFPSLLSHRGRKTWCPIKARFEFNVFNQRSSLAMT